MCGACVCRESDVENPGYHQLPTVSCAEFDSASAVYKVSGDMYTLYALVSVTLLMYTFT